MKPVIVLLPIDSHDRGEAETLDGQVYPTERGFLLSYPDAVLMSLEAHTDDLNNELYPGDYWTTFIYINE